MARLRHVHKFQVMCVHTKNLSRKAFTISEVMLAGFLLTAGMVSIMSLFSVAQRSARDTRDVIEASVLAQEGVEVVRNIRDNNIAYRAKNWTTGDNCSTRMNGDCDPFNNFPNGAASRRGVNYNSTSFIAGGNVYLSRSASGFQADGAGTFSGFYRVIKTQHTGSSDTARVQSFVTWEDPGNNLNGAGATAWCQPYNKCVYVELLLTTWK